MAGLVRPELGPRLLTMLELPGMNHPAVDLAGLCTGLDELDLQGISEALRRKLELPIRILSDVDGTLMEPLNIRHDGGMPPALIAGEVAKVNPSKDIFLATTFLLDERGVIRWVYRPDTYRMRASVDEIVAAIDALPAA
jgi:peroxiredoxin